MTVKELIERLSTMSQDAEILLVTDEGSIPFTTDPWICSYVVAVPAMESVLLMTLEMAIKVEQARRARDN